MREIFSIQDELFEAQAKVEELTRELVHAKRALANTRRILRASMQAGEHPRATRAPVSCECSERGPCAAHAPRVGGLPLKG